MKRTSDPCRENTEDELRQYVLDRPELLLKMLDLAEAWQERQHVASDSVAELPGVPCTVVTRG